MTTAQIALCVFGVWCLGCAGVVKLIGFGRELVGAVEDDPEREAAADALGVRPDDLEWREGTWLRKSRGD